MFAVPIFQSCNKKQTAQGFSHAVSDSFSIHDLVSEINLMTLRRWCPFFVIHLPIATVGGTEILMGVNTFIQINTFAIQVGYVRFTVLGISRIEGEGRVPRECINK